MIKIANQEIKIQEKLQLKYEVLLIKCGIPAGGYAKFYEIIIFT